jgi:hypothetical protein
VPPPLAPPESLVLEQPAKASENATLERNDSSNALKEVELVTLIVNLSD